MNDYDKSLNIITSRDDSMLEKYKIGIEKIISELTKFGLTKTQAKVFIYLGKYGSKTSPQVCKDLKLPRTETYHILNTLTNMGIVVSEFSHPARYSALPMEKAIAIIVKTEEAKINMLSESKKALSKLWNDIPCFFTKSSEEETEKFQMLQGSPRIHSKMKSMIENTKTGCKLVCGGKDLSRFYYSNIIEMFETSAVNTKIIISSESEIPPLIKNLHKSKIKIWPKNLAKNQCFLLKDDSELLIFLKNANFPARNIFAFWTNSQSLINSIKLLFEYSWQNSKPIKQEKLIAKI